LRVGLRVCIEGVGCGREGGGGWRSALADEKPSITPSPHTTPCFQPPKCREEGSRAFALRKVLNDNVMWYGYGTWDSFEDFEDHMR